MGRLLQVIQVWQFHNGVQGLLHFRGEITRLVFPKTMRCRMIGCLLTELHSYEAQCCNVNGEMHIIDTSNGNYRVVFSSMDRLPRDMKKREE
jgi:hypothetical protein